MTLVATIPPPAPAPGNWGWVRNGSAQVVGSDLELTEAGTGSTAGSAFYTTVVASDNLQVAFTTSMSAGSGGSGIALVLADPTQVPPTALGITGAGFGFVGIPGTAMVISTLVNNPVGSDGSAIGILTSTLGSPNPTLVASADVPPVRPGTHTWVVSVVHGTMTVTCDNTRVLSQAVTLPDHVMIGFTAANGAADDTHIVRSVTIQAAGSHENTPWLFNVADYGAVGDGQIVTDGAITSGSHNLACTTSAPFKKSDEGKPILVLHAAATGITTLDTTIATYVDPGHVTLAAAAGATVASGGIVMWATDDTAAIQATINAGDAYAKAFASPNVTSHPLYRVYSPPGAGAFYCVAGPLNTSGQGNGQLVIPVNGESAQGITCQIAGVESGAKTRYWNQAVPAMTASTWVSFGVFASLTAQNNAAANGRPAMISGPSGANGFGVPVLGLPKFSNVSLHIENMSLLTTHSAFGYTYDAVNAHGCARLILDDMSWGTTGTVPAGDYNTPAGFANGNSIGITMPANGNNAMNSVSRCICQGGYTFNIFATEHTIFDEICILLYGWVGLGLVGYFTDAGPSAVGALHAVNAPQITVEGCSYQMSIVGPGSGGIGPMFRGCMDTEGTNQFRETNEGGADGLASASALGELRLSGAGGTISTTYPTGLQIINDLQDPGPVATPSYTLGTAQINTYWRWATVILNGGTVTAVKVSQLMGGAAAPTMTTVWTGAITSPITIRIPPGGWWEIDGSVKPTVNSWELD